MEKRPFLPTARQTNWLLIVGFLALGYGLYMRYLVIEQPSVGLACQAGLDTWLCFSRKVVTALFNNSVFGWSALGAAALHFIRPSLFLLAVALAAAGIGISLYNVALSSLAVTLLILAFARPQPATE